MHRTFPRIARIAAVAALLVGAGSASAMDFFAAPVAAGAADCSTPADACTLGAAITVAPAGSRVIAAAGLYAVPTQGDAFLISKSLTVNGAQAGVDARTRSLPDGQESIIEGPGAVYLMALDGPGITVDGFTFRGTQTERALSVNAVSTGAIVQNNVFTGNAYGMSLATGAGPLSRVVHNRFTTNNGGTGFRGFGIYGDTGVSDTEIVENLFDGNISNAINLDEIFVPDPAAPADPARAGSHNLTIARNEIRAGSGIQVIRVHGLTIADNVMDLAGGSDVDPTDGIVLAGSVNDVTVRGNTIANAGRDGVRIDSETRFGHNPVPNGVIRITGNAITGSGRTVPGAAVHTTRVTPESIADSLTMFGNRLVGNLAGVYNGDGSPIDAVNNWWGCNTGPNTAGCDGTFGSVTANPWLVLHLEPSGAIRRFPGSTIPTLTTLFPNSAGQLPGPVLFPKHDATFTSSGGTLRDARAPLDGSGTLTNPLTLGAPGAWSVTVAFDNATATISGQVLAVTPIVCAPPPKPTPLEISLDSGKPTLRQIFARRPITATVTLSQSAEVSGRLEMWVTTPPRFLGQPRGLVKVPLGSVATVTRAAGVSRMRIVPTATGVAAARAALRRPGARANGWRIVGLATASARNVRAYVKVLGGRTVLSPLPRPGCGPSLPDLTPPRIRVTSPGSTWTAIQSRRRVRANVTLDEPAIVTATLVARVSTRVGGVRRVVSVMVGSAPVGLHPKGLTRLDITPRATGITGVRRALATPGARIVDWRINGSATDAVRNRLVYTTVVKVR